MTNILSSLVVSVWYILYVLIAYNICMQIIYAYNIFYGSIYILQISATKLFSSKTTKMRQIASGSSLGQTDHYRLCPSRCRPVWSLVPQSGFGIRVVGKGSWKIREVGKFYVGKKSVRHEIGNNEVGKFAPKQKSSGRSQKVRAEVGKIELKLESKTEVDK